MSLKELALCAVTAAILAGCSPSIQGSAGKEDFAKTARNIFGTTLVGTRGATPQDQDNIDDAVAGACAVGSYTADECRRHQDAAQ